MPYPKEVTPLSQPEDKADKTLRERGGKFYNTTTEHMGENAGCTMGRWDSDVLAGQWHS